MTTQVYPITENDQEIEIDLRNVGLGKSLEVAFSGDIGGGVISVYRRFYNNANEQIGEDVPLAYSWTNQTPAQLTGVYAGLTFEYLQPESSIVFKITGATAPDGNLLLLGIQPNA